jgi:ABC-type oligopeptide transport system substrate-binding subunit
MARADVVEKLRELPRSVRILEAFRGLVVLALQVVQLRLIVNYFRWQNQRFDDLVEQAASSSHPTQRLDLYHQADQILVADEAAVVPLYYYQSYGLLRPHLSIYGSGKIIRGGMFKFKDIVAG